MKGDWGGDRRRKNMACCRKYKKWDTVRLSRFRGQIGMDVMGESEVDKMTYTYIIQVLCSNMKLNTFNFTDLTTHERNE